MAEALEIIQTNEKVILFNSSPGCTTCAPTERALLNVKDELLGVVLIKIDTVDSVDLLGKFSIRSNGALTFIKNGVKQASLITDRTEDVLNTYSTFLNI
jgi:thiol-disulfide isomerase/thioredoxin